MASRPRMLLDFSLLYSLYQLARPLPRSWLLALGRGVGSLVWRVIGYRREVVRGNLELAFGDTLDQRARDDLAHSFYRNLGMTLMEFLALPRLGRGDILDLVELEGAEHLDQVRREGRGALLVSAHFGNWEYLGSRAAAEGLPVNFLVKSQHNERVDRMQNAIRAGAGVGVIRSDAPLTEMVRALRRGEFVGLLADQDAGRDGVFTDFLGHEASVFRGAAYLSWRLDIPIVTGYIFRRPGGRHLARLDSPLRPDRNLSEAEAVRSLTEAHVRRLEAAVAQAPDHFFWVHRRWKTQPSVEDVTKETP
ncbi:MAG: hypothetical protein GY838_12440 [bacterium]|nr:hypothetical protein [bacterium]